MKIMVMGSAGAGKSTVARQLGQAYDIPVFHLDRCFWKPGWNMSTQEEQSAIHKTLMNKNAWVIDGNYTTFFKERAEQTDKIIYLNLNRWHCFYRVLKRYVTNRGNTRSDMGEGCEEKFDLEFLVWIWNYHAKKKRKWIKHLETIEDKQVIVLNGSRSVNRYLNHLSEGNRDA